MDPGPAVDAAGDVTGERFDLDHVGAHVGQRRAGARRGHPARHLDDAHPVQRTDLGHLAHLLIARHRTR